jgi:hydrogenase maturation protease
LIKQDFRTALNEALNGKTGFIGIGNPDRGDDGFGVRLAEALAASGVPDVIVAGTVPENHITTLIDGSFDTLVLLDAVETGAGAGSVVLLNTGEIKSRFPQVSTHKISLGTLARLIERESSATVWLLGIQPAALQEGSGLSDSAHTTTELLHRILLDALVRRMQTEAECINS